MRKVVRAPLGVDLDGRHPALRDPDVRRRYARDADVLIALWARLPPEKWPGTALDVLARLRLALAEHRGDGARRRGRRPRHRDALRALGADERCGPDPLGGQPGRGARSTEKRTAVPGGAWAAAGRQEAGTTPMTG